MFILSLFLLLLLPNSSVLAQENKLEQRVVKVSSDEVVEKDFFLAGGEIVEISGEVLGDVIAAGGQVTIDGVVDGDILVVGGIVALSGEVTQDVRVAGGQVRISGIVGRNLTVDGGEITITDSAEIGGGAG